MPAPSEKGPSPGLAIGFTLACVVLAIATFKAFGGSTPLAAPGYRVQIPLPTAQTLLSGVRRPDLRGEDRSGLRRQPQREPCARDSRARFALRADAIRAHRDLRRQDLARRGIPGGSRPAPKDAPAIAERRILLQAESAPPSPSTISSPPSPPRHGSNMRDLLGGMAAAFDGCGPPALNGTLAYRAPLTTDLNAVLRTVDGQSKQLQRLFASSGDVLDALGRRTGHSKERSPPPMTSSPSPQCATGARRHGARSASVPATAQRDVGRPHRREPGPRFRPPRLRCSVVGPLHSAINRVIATALPMCVRSSVGCAPQSRPVGLPALTRILRATPVALRASCNPSLREVIPLAKAGGDLPTGEHRRAVGDRRCCGQPQGRGPGRQDHRTAGSGTLYFANETVGVGQAAAQRPLGSLPEARRARPAGQPRVPDQLRLPPFQQPRGPAAARNGRPPCLTQGPWTYRGKTAYYPRPRTIVVAIDGSPCPRYPRPASPGEDHRGTGAGRSAPPLAGSGPRVARGA